ncbi:hypothetical protein ACXWRW_11265, partial [Streptococcus pyogenes]
GQMVNLATLKQVGQFLVALPVPPSPSSFLLPPLPPPLFSSFFSPSFSPFPSPSPLLFSLSPLFLLPFLSPPPPSPSPPSL